MLRAGHHALEVPVARLLARLLARSLARLLTPLLARVRERGRVLAESAT